MREIKFRFWNKLARTYKRSWRNAICYDGKFIEYDPDMMAYDDPIDFSKSIVIAQQYTGLKDKNGKEVYEGDIVVEQHDGNEGETIGKVFFAAGTFMIDGDGPLYEHVYSLTPDILEDYIVVGNIFENPELLKQ